MVTFLVFAALLVALAIVIAVGPLWRDSRRLALALAVALPLATIGVYGLLGTPAALDPRNTAPIATDDPASIEAALAALEQRVAAGPDRLEDLVLLARSYMAMERYAEAPTLFARAVALAPEDADLAVDYAESLLRTAPDRRFPPAAVAQLEAALALQPQHQRGLFFQGLYLLQREQPAEAAATWERLLPLLEPSAAVALRTQVDAARNAAGLPPLPAGPVVPGVDITIDIAPEFVAQMPAGAALFVFARAQEGRGPPLAARRIEVAQWPVRLRLTDADSPMPAAKLSTVPQALFVARLSRSGNAEPAPGDIESAAQVVATDGSVPVTLVLVQARP